MNLHRIQRGIPRTVQETIDEIKHRYELAITSTESAVKAAQTVSGVKGTIAQHWIAKIIQKRGDLVATYITSRETRDPRLNEGYRTGEHRATLKNSIMKGIEGEFREWLYQQPEHNYNALPEDSRRWSSFQPVHIPFIVSTLYIALRKEIRRGDHYNILLGYDGEW